LFFLFNQLSPAPPQGHNPNLGSPLILQSTTRICPGLTRFKGIWLTAKSS
jgi:hypothetical protein